MRNEFAENGSYDIVYGYTELILLLRIIVYMHKVMLVITWSNI